MTAVHVIGLVADVIIIGAGAAGIGCGSMLQNVFGLDPSRVLVLERGTHERDG